VIVATANVLKTLGQDDAARSLNAVMIHRPQMVGLQEWDKSRRPLLALRGRVFRLPRLRKRLGRKAPTSGYVFGYPLGGAPPVGVDAEWGELLAVRTITLAKGRGVRATKACEALIRERATGALHVVLNLHLLAHHDRPAYAAAWRQGRAAAIEWAESWHGFNRWVMGDTNKHLMALPPLVSCWHGNKVDPTFGPRTIDNIYADRHATHVHAIETPSDHNAVVADYKETR
jgi:hypothetical protein